MAIRFDDIGNRLKAFRLGSGLSADEIAGRLGISRTALYRFEKGELAKIETLEKLADLLDVSVPTLLGVGEIYAHDARTLLLALWPQSRAARAIAQRRSAALTLVADGAFFQAQLRMEPLEGDFGGLAGFAATIAHGDAQRVGYARLATGVTFTLEGERTEVLARWQRQVEHLRRAAARLQ